MASCECIAACPFFNDKMANMPAVADIYKQKYCLEDNSQCARHMVIKALGREHVPADLFPNMLAKAIEVIKQAS